MSVELNVFLSSPYYVMVSVYILKHECFTKKYPLSVAAVE